MKKHFLFDGAKAEMSLTGLKSKRLSRLLYRPLPFGLRLISWIVVLTQLLAPCRLSVLAATQPATTTSVNLQQEIPNTEGKIIPNRTLPQVRPPLPLPEFSENPSELELFNAHIFGLPLVPVGAQHFVGENKELSQALVGFLKRTNYEDVGSLTGFLDKHPTSPWRASLLFNLGKVYRSNGYISHALDCWENAWDLVRSESGDPAKTIANATLGELAELYGRLGRSDAVEKMLVEAETREVSGVAATKLFAVRQGLWIMKTHPEKGFMCGPAALSSVLASLGEKDSFPAVLQNACSTTNGTSLAQLKLWSDQMKMHMRMAKRDIGADVPLPAVVNWKAGHFAALVKKEGGRYLMKDPIFEQEIWMSEQAVDAECSGYFLIPDGHLLAGWKEIGNAEAQNVWGKGPANSGPLNNQGPYAPRGGKGKDGPNGSNGNAPNGDGDPDDDPPDDCHPPGMAYYQLNALLASLTVLDTPLTYTPPRGARVHFTITYDQFDVNLLSGLNVGNVGPNFNYNYLSFVINDPTKPTSVDLFMREGGVESYANLNTNTMNYAMQPSSKAIIHQNNATNFVRTMPNGSKEIYDVALTVNSQTVVLLTKIVDALGNTNSLTYDANYRLVAISDAIGQVTTVSYASTNASNTVWFYKIAQVTDPFGRSAYFTYNTNSPYQLIQSTDVIGMNSQYTYTTNNYMSVLITPYGTNTFVYTQSQLSGSTNTQSVQVTDPEGNSEMTMFVGAYAISPAVGVQSVPPSDVAPTNMSVTPVNGFMQFRNTFYWDKNAMKRAPGDFTQAKTYHWLHASSGGGVSQILESEKQPLEARIWYNYPGQTTGDSDSGIYNSSASQMARVMDDGATQLYQYEYTNIYGKITKRVDPLGRTTLYTYATNGIDLVQVRQVKGTNNDILNTITYNSQHLPLMTIDAAGQTNLLGYNAYGQLTATTNALGQSVTMNYDTNGYLTNIVGSLPGATTSYTYDGYGRVLASTDSDGYATIYAYDNLDRISKITHPDGTFEQISYQRLDPILRRDRRGHWTATTYDTLRRIRDIRDSLNRVTHFEWCGCGSLESITDPLGNTTSWTRDIQGRQIAKTFPDSTQMRYSYSSNSGRLVNMTDAKGQITLYTYFADNNLSQVTYSNAVITTPSVSFTYDANYNRMLTMVDGTGTTTYSYNPISVPLTLGAGLLASVTNPATLGNSVITYQYDQLGRVTNRAIDGVAIQTIYDALGRVNTTTNALGSFSNAYVNATFRLSSASYPNGQGSSFSYFNTNGDLRLQSLLHTNSAGGTISKFDYTCDADGQIATWTKQADSTSTNTFTFQYDPVDQLVGAVLAQTGVATNILKQYIYSYDGNGNRMGEQIDSNPTGAQFNNLNQLTNLISNGLVLFSGNASKTSAVSVAGSSAVMTNQTNFAAYVVTTNGSNKVQITATDWNNNRGVTNYQLVVSNNSMAKTLVYDLNGNLTSVTTTNATNTYEWDAANRLTAINEASTNRSEFAYDGAGRRVQIAERNPTSHLILITKRFVWCGEGLCEERDSAGTSVTKRFFNQGEQISGTNYFFTRDHLGSVREMTDAAGTIHAQYNYDPYGRISKVSGDLNADFGFTGHYVHLASGLNLTLYRAYDSTAGRWLSRDPSGEAAGANLYAYVLNKPIAFVDTAGLNGYFIGIGGVLAPIPGLIMPWVGGGINVGVTDQGQLFVQPYGEYGLGAGVYGGVGVNFGAFTAPKQLLPICSSSSGYHLEGDVGLYAAVGGSVDFDPNSHDISASISPLAHIGVGMGALIGGGKSFSSTIAAPSFLGGGNSDYAYGVPLSNVNAPPNIPIKP